MARRPPAGLIERPESLFRRTRREAVAFLSLIRKEHVFYFLIALLIVAVHVGLLSTPYFDRLEYIFLDSSFKHRPPIATHSAVAYIDMDEKSIQAIGRWPWPRRYHAVLTHLLTQAKAKAVVFDVLFSEPSSELDDGALEEAFRANKNLYLPVVPEQKGNEEIWIHSLPQFEQYARGLGHIRMLPDQDGVLRRVQPHLRAGDEAYPHLAFQVAYDYLDEPGKLAALKNSDETFLVNWAGKWEETFEHYSFVDLIKSYEEIQNGKQPMIPLEKLKDKICIVGLTALGLTDIKPNPISPTFPGVGVHAHVINDILTNQFIRHASFRVNAFCLIGIAVLTVILFIVFRNVWAFIGSLGIGIAWIFVSYFFFWQKGVWLYVANPIATIVALSIFSTAFMLIMRDIERTRLFKLATQDGLTGLCVIRYFRLLLNKAAEEMKKRRKPLSVVLSDIDHFKDVNDTHGHACGDMVLREVAKIFQACVAAKRPSHEKDIAARYGGEEFIIMLNNCSARDAVFLVAERVRKQVEEYGFMWEGKKVPITISLGVAEVHSEESVPDPAVLRADAALYRAKEGGRNQVCMEEYPEKGAKSD